MPDTAVRFYQERNGRVPVLDYLTRLRNTDRRTFGKCVARVRRLAEWGHELRRPEADYLQEGLHELRIRSGNIQMRILYFFHGRNIAILVHALKKEGKIPANDIETARLRMNQFKADPESHCLEYPVQDMED